MKSHELNKKSWPVATKQTPEKSGDALGQMGNIYNDRYRIYPHETGWCIYSSVHKLQRWFS